MKKRTFTIDRATWVNGSNNGWENLSKMLNNQNNMCCLGHIASQCGFKMKDLRGLNTPMCVVKRKRCNPAGFLTWADCGVDNTPLAKRAMLINDDSSISNTTREKKLKILFAQHNVTLKFTGKHPK